MSRILIIDDEEPIRSVMSGILEDEDYTVFTAEDGPSGLEFLKTEPIDLIFLDVWMPKMGGLEVLEHLQRDFPGIQVIIISGHGNVDMAVKAIKKGAYDFIEKPLDIDKILNMAADALRLQKEKNREEPVLQTIKPTEILGSSKGINQVRTLIDQSAPTDSRVMILGENGTGKELVAHLIHAKSERKDKPFIEVNCAAIPDNLIESELFGHEKGSFTGAVGQRIGRFEAADGGTLFMDEVADMSLQAQAKVLRAIQEMRFERVGGHEPVHVDVRIICATNKDIQKEIQDGNFREDLFFRLNVIQIDIPSLKERSDDIPELLENFTNQYCSRSNIEQKSFSKKALKKLKEYEWPGNIRELKNFSERISVMCEGSTVTPEDVEENLVQMPQSSSGSTLLEADYESMKLSEAREHFERQLLIAKLEENGYNISATAEVLGIYPSNLHSKIKKYGIDVKK